MADAAELDAVWRQTVAEFDRGLSIAKGLLKRGQFANAMGAIEQCQALLGVMDSIQQTSRVVPIEQRIWFVPAIAHPEAPTVAELGGAFQLGGYVGSVAFVPIDDEHAAVGSDG